MEEGGGGWRRVEEGGGGWRRVEEGLSLIAVQQDSLTLSLKEKHPGRRVQALTPGINRLCVHVEAEENIMSTGCETETD